MAVGDRIFVHSHAGDRVGPCGIGAVLIPFIETTAQTGSTNADLLARLAAGEDVGEGAWLVADRQTAGRGRLGRNWNDGLGNFMGSTVVRLKTLDPAPASLALVAAIALAKAVAIAAPGLDVRIKWPNDLLIDGAKCAGILMESNGAAVVIGIGVNLIVAPEVPGRPTASLLQSGAAVDRDDFARTLAVAMADALWMWRQQGVAPVIAEWLRRAHPVGTALHISEQDIDGVFDGLAPDGALRLRRANGETMLIHAGDVEWRRSIGEE